ncbi:MAG: TonB-dependent receptor [Porticoccaceae bacterium]|nr:TonB-dependent receptor [Porticoccaceae bacterium]
MANRPTFKRKTLSAAVATSCALIAIQAQAQAPQVEEIIVTAAHREQSVLDVPYNISAVSGEVLEMAHIVDNADLMRYIPGVGVVDRGYRNSGVLNGVTIRGLNLNGSALGDYALNTVPSVSTYVDQTPIYANFLLRDINRVEVLRGPQGTLYGSGSLGGTVRYIMNEPSLDDTHGKVNAGVAQAEGSEGINRNAYGVFNLPLSETVAVRVSGGRIDNDGIVDYVNVYELDANGVPVAPSGVLSTDAVFENREDADTVEIDHLRASLLFEPNDSARFILSHQYQSDDIGGRRQQTVGLDGLGEAYGDYQNGSVQLEPSSRDVDMTSLEAEFDLGFATLSSSTSAYEHTGESVSENTGFYAQLGWLGAYYYNYSRPMASAYRSYDDQAFTQEIRLVSNGDGAFDYVAGIYYRDQDTDSTQTSSLVGFKDYADLLFGGPVSLVISDVDFDYSREENFVDKAVFGELTYHASDSFRVTGGLRYFENEFSSDFFAQIGLYTSFNVSDTASSTTKEDDVLFKLNASWDVGEDTMLYGTMSEGYRRGGSNALPTAGFFAEDPAWLAYASDSNTNYELGVKGSQGSTRYSAAVYYVDWQDVQVDTATTNFAFFAAANGESAATQGLELELEGFLTEALHYTAGYAYTDAKLSGDLVTPTGGVIAADGARLPGSSEHTISLALDHSSELFGMLWINRLDAYYQSSTENAVNSSARFNAELDGFSLYHLSTTLVGDEWDASVYIRNLTNEEGTTGLFSEAYMGTSAAQNYLGNGSKEFLVQPRTLGMTISYKF